MRHVLMSVYDSKAAAFLPPFTLPTIGMAKRTFADCAQDLGHAFARHPGDYTLFELGWFDDSTGQLVLHTPPISHGQAGAYLGQTREDGNLPLFPETIIVKSNGEDHAS